MIEPSAAAGLFGPVFVYGTEGGNSYIKQESLNSSMDNSTHIVWATGGIFVPEELKEQFYLKGKKLTEKE